MQEVILGALSAGLLGLIGILIQGIRADMRAMRAEFQTEIRQTRVEMAEGFRHLGERIAANGDRIAALEGIISVTPRQPDNPPQLPVSTEAEAG